MLNNSALIKPSQNGKIVPNALVKRKVNLSVVDEVNDPDFKQAQVVFEAWEKIGWDPGMPVVNALNQGHGYAIQEFKFNEKFSERIRRRLSEIGIYQDALVSFNTKVVDASRLIGARSSSGTELILPSLDLSLIEESEEKIINMVAIKRRSYKLVDTRLRLK